MLQQWDGRGEREMIITGPREVKNLPNNQKKKRGGGHRTGSESKATLGRAHSLLVGKAGRGYHKDKGQAQ